VVCVALMSAASGQDQLQPRTSYTIPLARLSVSLDEASKSVERVRISYDGSDDYINIGPVNDEYVEMTRKGRTTRVYQESPDRAYTITEFEGEHLYKVTDGLVQTLVEFETDLQKEHWDKIRYLDGYLPRFLRGYYFLCDAMVCHQDGLPRVARVPENAFDVSLVSPKTDERVQQWRTTPDHIIKLRIATKELVYQLQAWEKVAKRDSSQFFGSEAKKAFSLFIRIYFNLPPPPKAPSDGEHL
jgi:hypothetical protein